MALTFENDLQKQQCGDCRTTFTAIHGTVLEQGREKALYYIGLHGHEADAPAAKMNLILVLVGEQDVAATLTVFLTDEGAAFRFEDWDADDGDGSVRPFKTADEARASPHSDTILELAWEAIQSVPEALDYLGAEK